MREMENFGKIWGKNVGKVGKICQNEKLIGMRYQWKWHIEILKYGKDEKWCQNMGKMERDAKICNCMHVTKCDKNTKNPKSPIRF